MDSTNVLVMEFFRYERQKKRRFVIAAWVVVILADIVALAAYLYGVDPYNIGRFLALPFMMTLAILWSSLRHQRSLQERLTRLLDTVEFGWEELHGLDLNEKEADFLHGAFAATAAAREATNESFLRTRGTDEKGPAFDAKEPQINTNNARVDPSVHEQDYEGLEDDLRISEQLVEEANQHYAKEAQRQWEVAEAKDMDAIEAGVERLGDLVATGWFEQNPKDGAVKALMESHTEGDSQ